MKLGTESLARQKEFTGGKLTQQVGVKKTQAQIQRERTYAQAKAKQIREQKEIEATQQKLKNVSLADYGTAYEKLPSSQKQYFKTPESIKSSKEYKKYEEAISRQQNVANVINDRLRGEAFSEGAPSWMNASEQAQYQQAMDSASSRAVYAPGTYIDPSGLGYSMREDYAMKELGEQGGTYYGEEFKYTAPVPSTSTKGFNFEVAAKEYGVSTTEVKRYKDLGYTSKEARILARESENVGGMTFSPEYSKSLLPVKQEEKKSWVEEKYDATGKYFGVSTSLVKPQIGFGFPGVGEQSKRLVTEPEAELKRAARGTGLGVSFGGGSMLLGATIYNIPRATDIGKETVYSSQRQKELTIATEQYNVQQSKLINPSTKEFIGTEEQFKQLEIERENIDVLKEELKTRKATKKELVYQFGVSMGSAALFGGVLTGTGFGLKKGGSWLVSKSPSWLGKTMSFTGTGIEKVTQFYFTQKFIGEGIDIAGSVKRKEYELAKLRTAELGGGIIGYSVGARISKSGIDKGFDLYRTKGMKELPIADYTTKPFWKQTEGKYVFMKRYEGFKTFKPSTWKPTLKGYKKGQFIGRQYKLLPFEVQASMKGKKDVSYWKIEHKTKKVSWVTEKATAFPFDKPSTHLKWFEKYGRREYGLPGTPKEVSGKPFGFSATGEAWKGTKFDVKPFKYKGGEIDLAAYQYYSGKGISGYFYRIGGRKYSISFKGSLFGDTSTPTTYAGYFKSVKKGSGAKEVKGTQDGRELKAYLFKEKMKLGEGVIPGVKKEVELTTTFTERKPFAEKYFFKLFGRNVPVVQQTFGKESSSFGAGLPTIKDVGSGVSSIPSYTPTRVYLFGGVTTPYQSEVSMSEIPSVSYKSNVIKEFKVDSSIIKSSYKPTSYKSTSYKLKSYKPTSYKPTSYKPTSYKPTSYKKSSYKSSLYEPTSYTSSSSSRIIQPPKRTPGKFPSFPKIGLGKEIGLIKYKKKRKIARTPSLVALGQKITAYKTTKGEASGLTIRPIIISKPKTKRRKSGKKKKKI